MTNVLETFESLFRKKFGREPTQDEIYAAIDQSVRSYNQSGGITAHTVNTHTVNLGPAQRKMDNGLRSQILRDLPRDRPITVIATMGNVEAYNLAEEVHAFLKVNGFILTEDGITQSVFRKPVQGLQFDRETCSFIVGSNS